MALHLSTINPRNLTAWTSRSTTSADVTWRSLHDLGLATWFGSSVLSAATVPSMTAADAELVALESDSGREIPKRKQSAKAASADMAVTTFEQMSLMRWSPVIAASIAAHAVGTIGMLVAGHRTRHPVAKSVLTAAAVGLTLVGGAAKARALSLREMRLNGNYDGDVRRAQGRAEFTMRVIEPVLPVVTGSLMVLTAIDEEEPRARDLFRRAAASVRGVG